MFYLTGFNQPDAAIILASKDLHQRLKPFTMFCQPYDPQTEIWDGPRAGIEGALDVFGADQAHPITKFESRLKKIVAEVSITSVFTCLPLDQPIENNLMDGTHIQVESASATHANNIQASKELTLARLDNAYTNSWFSRTPKIKVKPLKGLVDELRLIKSTAEVNLLRQSGRIAGRSFTEAMKQTKPGMTEHQIHSILEFYSKMEGASFLSYVPVVAGGINALTLHYVNNSQILKDGDLLLVDCGCEYNGYASDITRTWPINGVFSIPQRELYQLVLDVQKEIIKVLIFIFNLFYINVLLFNIYNLSM